MPYFIYNLNINNYQAIKTINISSDFIIIITNFIGALYILFTFIIIEYQWFEYFNY